MRSLVSLLLAAVLLSCAGTAARDTGGYIIRYVNLGVIYEYELSKSNEAVMLKNKKEGILKKLEALKEGQADGGQEAAYYREELKKIQEEEKKIKSALYLKIKTAVETVAKKHEVDFLLSTGEGVIYSKPVYDLTSEVIAELDKMRTNSSPVWK